MKSKEVFLKPDKRRINNLYKMLLKNKSLKESCYEDIARLISEKKFNQMIIFTGFPKNNTFETDGPLGAFVLADTFFSKLNIQNIILLIPPLLLDMLSDLIKEILPNIKVFSVDKIPIDIDLNLTTLGISVEFPGINRVGIAHHMDGNAIKFDYKPVTDFWRSINKYNKNSLTIGIGDGGNEMGLGCYETEIRGIIPLADVCTCPCQNGIASNVIADKVLLATTSNWGAYALSSLFNYEFSYDQHFTYLKMLNERGIVDGVTQKCTPTVDNIDPVIEKKIVQKLFLGVRH